MNLNEAITAVQTAETTLSGTQPALTAAQARLAQAQADVNAAASAELTAETAFNDSLDVLIAAATAAKVSTGTGQAPPPPLPPPPFQNANIFSGIGPVPITAV